MKDKTIWLKYHHPVRGDIYFGSSTYEKAMKEAEDSRNGAKLVLARLQKDYELGNIIIANR